MPRTTIPILGVITDARHMDGCGGSDWRNRGTSVAPSDPTTRGLRVTHVERRLPQGGRQNLAGPSDAAAELADQRRRRARQHRRLHVRLPAALRNDRWKKLAASHVVEIADSPSKMNKRGGTASAASIASSASGDVR